MQAVTCEKSVASWQGGAIDPQILACRKIFYLSENILPKIPNSWLQIPHFGGTKGRNLNFEHPVISFLGNLQLLSVGKLQLSGLPSF